MSENTPLVSIIVSNYNYAPYLQTAIKSIIAQTYTNWELIIADDCSTDESVEIIQQYKNLDSRITLLTSPINQKGPYPHNKAFSICRGKYIAIMDADDFMAATKLARQVEYLEEHADIDIVGTYIIEFDEHNKPLESKKNETWFNIELDLNNPENWILQNHLCHSSSLIRKVSRDRVGPYNTDLVFNFDYEFWARCLANNLKFHVLPEQLTYYRVHSNSITTRYPKLKPVVLAYIFCTILAPTFVRRGRLELVDKAITIFLESADAYYVEGATPQIRRDLATKLVVLQGSPLTFTEFEEIFEQAARPSYNYERYPVALSAGTRMVTLHHEFIQQLNYHDEQQVKKFQTAPALLKNNRKMVVLDDRYPNVGVTFRTTEFNHYLQHLNCEVYSTEPNFDQHWQEYARYYPEFKDKIHRFNPYQIYDCALIYSLFVRNTYKFLPVIEQAKTPFVFTLYPGAGFELYQAESDRKLKALFNSRYFRRVIVTQNVTQRYLLERELCQPEKITFIYAGAEPAEYFQQQYVPKQFYRTDKATFDVCFVAAKYMEKGINKGFDTFIHTAKKLAELRPDFQFHVVGNFDQSDMDITGLEGRIKFYGFQLREFFPAFYSNMDIILSPNVPFRLNPGNFDGFPTGCCVEAGFAGVAIFHADELKENQNNTYIPDKELCIINTNPDDIVKKVLYYSNNLDQLYKLSKAGQSRFYQIYSTESQLVTRLNLLEKYI